MRSPNCARNGGTTRMNAEDQLLTDRRKVRADAAKTGFGVGREDLAEMLGSLPGTDELVRSRTSCCQASGCETFTTRAPFCWPESIRRPRGRALATGAVGAC